MSFKFHNQSQNNATNGTLHSIDAVNMLSFSSNNENVNIKSEQLKPIVKHVAFRCCGDVQGLEDDPPQPNVFHRSWSGVFETDEDVDSSQFDILVRANTLIQCG